jgi:RHS repeat-associated protein
LSVQYDSSGRFVSLVTPSGQTNIVTNVGALTQTVTDAMGNPTTISYDADGNVTKIVNAMGGTTTNVYDSNDDLLATTDPLGHTTGYTYDDVGDELSQTDSLGNTTRYTYDDFGDVLTTSDPLGNTTTNTYDTNGNLIQTVSPTGAVESFTYDANGDMTSDSGPDGITSYTYDSSGNMLSSTSPTGVTTYYTYDDNNDQTSSQFTWVNPANPSDRQLVSTQQVYNSNGQATASTDEHGNTSYTTYNADGQDVQDTDELGNVTSYIYNAAGQVIQTTNPDGTITRTVYDADGRAVWTDDDHVDGQATDGTETVYDALGDVIETEQAHNVVIAIVTQNGVSSSELVSAGAVFSTTETGYNAAGQVTQTTDAAGNTTYYQLNADGQTVKVTDPLGDVTQTEYDAAGRVVGQIDALGHTTRMFYDADGNLIKTIYPDGTSTSATYDADGQEASETDQMGLTTSYRYDGTGNLIAVIEPAVLNPATGHMVNPATQYAYDAYGDMVQVTDALGRVTRYSFDQFGNQLTEALPMGQTKSSTYDSYGRLATSTDFDGQKTVYHYDSLDRVDTTTYYAAGATTPGETISYQFDSLGRLAQVTDTQGSNQRVTLYGYDAENDITSIATPEGTVSYVFDPATDEHTSTATINTDTQYSYDALGRLSTVTVDMLNGTTLSTPLVTTYYYTPLGNIDHITYPNGTETDYGYDAATGTHLASVVNKEGSTLLSSYSYTLNADGMDTSDVERELEADGSYSTRTFTWSYDSLNRLTQETLVSSIVGESYSTSYVLDLVGNRLSATTTNSAGTQVVSDSYNANDELTTESGTLNGSASYETSYGYDANGSQISVSRTGTSPETDTYTYDLRGDLATGNITRQESGQTVTIAAAYTYNEDGIRVAENTTTTVGEGSPTTQVTQDLLDPANPSGYVQVLEERVNGAGVPSTTYIIGQTVLGQNGPSGILYLLTDGHGSTRLVINAAGTVAARYLYDAFGDVLDAATGITSPLVTHILYTGEYFDTALGQYYLRARYYDASIGRFTSMDSFEGRLADPQTLATYQYTGMDPVNRVDASGHDFDPGDILTGIADFIGVGALSVLRPSSLGLKVYLAYLAGVGSAADAYNNGGSDPIGDVISGFELGFMTTLAGEILGDWLSAAFTPLTNTFSRVSAAALKKLAGEPVSIKELSIMLGKTGQLKSAKIKLKFWADADIPKDGRVYFGKIAEKPPGTPVKEGGRYVIFLSSKALETTEGAVMTVGHELFHLAEILATGAIQSADRFAEVAGANYWKRFVGLWARLGR